jgi:hypothetical protein
LAANGTEWTTEHKQLFPALTLMALHTSYVNARIISTGLLEEVWSRKYLDG